MKPTAAAQTILTISACLFSFTVAVAQPGGLIQDTDFFNQQKETYQRWLDHSGMGKVLHVEELKVEEEGLSLYLGFPYSDIDSIVRAWESLKREFEVDNPITLEQQLFYKMVNLMEVRQSLADVQIYDTYDLRREPLFFRGIYFEEGKVKVEESNPKSKIREIKFSPNKLGEKMKGQSVEEFNKRYSKEAVYGLIYPYAKQYFEQKRCEGRYPEVRLLENDEVLRFEAIDLCREVLTEAANPLLAEALNIFGLNYNWVKREKLDITIAYKKLDTGFSLYITIDGKYGSGLYSQVGRGGYYSMEIDFDEYLEVYADLFKERLRNEILK